MRICLFSFFFLVLLCLKYFEVLVLHYYIFVMYHPLSSYNEPTSLKSQFSSWSEHLTVKWAPRKWGAVRLPFLSVPTPSSFQWRSGSGTTWCDHLWVCGEAYAHALFYFVPLFFVPPFFLPSFWITSFYYGVLSLLLSLHYFF